VNELVMDSIEANARYAANEKVSLRPVLSEDGLESVVLCDRHLAQVALDNIVRNAIRFSPEGESMDVEVRHEADRVGIAVRDRGPGCPVEILHRLFDRFAQSNEERRTGRGAGIGLEVAHGIMELHEGDITVANLEDGGCRFELWFERRARADEPSEGESDADRGEF
jgi:signal transduction histidine kinase